MLILPILSMQWNVNLILILLLLLIASLSILFYRIKTFPKIRIWFILLVASLSIVFSFFNIPDKFYLSGVNSGYDLETQSVIVNYILTCRVINTIIFLTISYLKYLKIQRNESNRIVDHYIKSENNNKSGDGINL
jgi:hypothetical protein